MFSHSRLRHGQHYSTTFFVASLLLLCSYSVTGQSDIGCFVSGECRNAYTLGLTSSDSSTGCLEYCQGTAECRYFTQYQDDKVCFAFRDCPAFAVGTCADCISGESGCSSGGQGECGIEGECVGTLIGIEAAADTRDCASDCWHTNGCNFWTYNVATSICQFYFDCDEIDTSCTTCISGEVDCGSGKPSTQMGII